MKYYKKIRKFGIFFAERKNTMHLYEINTTDFLIMQANTGQFSNPEHQNS